MEVVLYIVVMVCMLPVNIYAICVFQRYDTSQLCCQVEQKQDVRGSYYVFKKSLATPESPFEPDENDQGADFWHDNGCECDECRADWWKNK